MKKSLFLLCCLNCLGLYACDDNHTSSTSVECQGDSDCAVNTDGRTSCNLNTNSCETPASTNKCTKDADCASRTDGMTKCNTSSQKCEKTATTPECTKDVDCASRTDGMTKCNTSSQKCEKPECTKDDDCSARTDDKTKCNTSANVCYNAQAQISCGDKIMNGDEACDANDLGNKTCASVGALPAGKLKCTNECTLDTSECFECIDNSFCAGNVDGNTVCGDDHVCTKPPKVQAVFNWGVDYTCGMDTFLAPNTPTNHNHDFKVMTGEPFTIYGLIYINGCTTDHQWCNKVVGSKLLYIEADQANKDFSQWARFNAEANPFFNFSGNNINNNEYMATFSSADMGKYRYVYSFDLKQHPYDENEIAQTVYCYVDWASEKSTDKMGTAEIIENTSTYYCGDGEINQSGERCDTNDLGGKQCSDLEKYVAGTLQCAHNCQYDTSLCYECTPTNTSKCGPGQVCVNSLCTTPVCGDGEINQLSETCDRNDFDNKECTDFPGFVGGTLSCASDCSTIDTSGCVECTMSDLSKCSENQYCDNGKCKTYETTAKCGDGVINQDWEQCDGADMNNITCANMSQFVSGTIKCNNCQLDLSECVECTDADRSKCGEGQICHEGKCESSCGPTDAQCLESSFSLMSCVDGHWSVSACPDEKPYCKTGAEGCSDLKYGQACNPDTFVPFVHDGYEYTCGIKVKGDARIIKESCDGECMIGKDGVGANTSNGRDCSVKGQIKVLIDDYPSDGGSLEVCCECKPNQNGELYWLEIPATYSYASNGNPSDCTPNY